MSMRIARTVARTSNCSRRQVGAVIACDDVFLISAANGTPTGVLACKAGGCLRCLSNTPSGESYDSCICIHAEQAAIAQAANKGVSVQGATMYCTLRPCLNCLNLCLHSGISTVVYDEYLQFSSDVEEAYAQLLEGGQIRVIRCSE